MQRMQNISLSETYTSATQTVDVTGGNVEPRETFDVRNVASVRFAIVLVTNLKLPNVRVPLDSFGA